MGGLPPVFIEFLGSSKGVKTAMRDVKGELAAADAEGAGSFKKTGMLGKAAIAGLGIAAAAVAVKTVHMAGDFQVQMTRVRTGAGEAAKNMHLVGQGVLAMAGEVGQSTTELTAGLYTVESAGYHGSDALKVLKTSAQGAKVGAASLATTTDAVTTAMNAYKSGAGSTTTVMNALIATEGEGKTNLEALAGSMSTILPTAATAKVGLNEVLGAMATMTAQGTPAKQAATYLRQTIGQLSNPSAKAATEMQNLGLSAVKVGQELGNKGLAATLTTLTDAIQKKMGPAGTVLIKHLQGAAKNTSSFQRALADLPPKQQTYIGALATMVGGTKSMQAALELTGPHMTDFKNKTAGIAEHVKAGGKSIEGWSDVQKNFNQQTAQAKASLEALGIQIGQYLMPAFQAIVRVLGKAAAFLAKHTLAAKIAAGVIGGILVFAIVSLSIALYDLAAAAAVNPVTWIVIAVIALIAAIVLLVMHWKTVWGFIKRISADVAKAVVSAWHWVASGTASIWHSITGAVTKAWHSVVSFFMGAWHMAVNPIVNAWKWLQRTTMVVWNSITGFFRKWWPLLLVVFATPIALLIAGWNHFHTAITNTAKSAWNAISAFFVMQWNAIKAVAGMAWEAIRVAIINPFKSAWHGLVSAGHSISHALSAAWSAIRGAASAAWSRIRSAMINPLISAWHSVTSTMGRVRSAITGPLSSAYNTAKGYGSKFLSVGKAIVMGMVHGIESGASSVGSAARHVAESALTSAKHFLGVRSPSRKFREIGTYINAGLVEGLEGSAARVKSASTRIAAMLYREFGSAGHRGLQALVRRDGAALNRLASQRTSIANRLKTANKKLADLQKEWTKTRDSVAASVMQNVSVVTALPEGSVSLTASDVVANMRDQVTKAKAFAAELQTLRKKGLSTELIQQIASSGVDQGGATAAALSTATGAQIKEINKQQAAAKKAAGSVGTAVADSMYKSGINSAKGLVKGLQSQEKAIQKQMDKIAKSMAASIKKALKIHSPSQVFAEIGDFVAQGLAQGVTSGTSHATDAATAMAGAVTAAGVPSIPRLFFGARAAMAAGSAGAARHMAEVTTIVQLDSEVLYKQVQRKALQYERRNTSNGLALAK